jgi:uncharacterized membrane protein
MSAVQLKSPLTGESMSPMESANFLAHYYRGELSRAISWRDRLDRTTNWAIAATAAMLSVSMTNYDVHHSLMLFSMPLIFLLLVIEARRYRFFDVYRRRMRIFERCFYANLFDPPGKHEPALCMKELGESLRRPQFSVSMKQAMARRLRRNYCWIFSILLAGWLLKVVGTIDWKRLVDAPQTIHQLAAIGWTPGWIVMALVLGFYAWLVYVMVRYGGVEEEQVFGEVYV